MAANNRSSSKSKEDRASDSAGSGRWVGRLIVMFMFAVVVIIAVAVIRFFPVTHSFYTDADTIRRPVESTKTRDILWQPPRQLAEIINTQTDDYEPRISADGTTLFFVRGKAGQNAEIFTSTRLSDGWSDPTPLTEVNSPHDDLGPEPSADGQTLYF